MKVIVIGSGWSGCTVRLKQPLKNRKELKAMIGTVVDYSSYNDCVPWIKVLSGEDIYTFYPREFDKNIRMGADVEFVPGENKYTII